MNRRTLADLFPVNQPESVLEEVCAFLRRAPTGFDPSPLRLIYVEALRLYQGKWAGYRACDTAYHDFTHVAGVFLAMARLIHGALLQKRRFGHSLTRASLAAAILHDSGYILAEDEPEGSGAAHKHIHEKRSMVFLERHGQALGLPEAEISAGQVMIRCTYMKVDPSSVVFRSGEIASLGRMLAVADLVAQLSEPTYLEKLPLLQAEDAASSAPQYAGETDVIRKAVDFYPVAERRLARAVPDWERLMQAHFAARWGISENLYREAIARQKQWLESNLAKPGGDTRRHLRRMGTLNRTRRVYASGHARLAAEPEG